MSTETMIYPFTEDAQSKLTQLMFFGRVEKIAIAAPTDAPPYLIVDHVEFINHPDYGLVPGYRGEEKKRTAIRFNYSKDEIKYDDATKDNVWRGQKK